MPRLKLRYLALASILLLSACGSSVGAEHSSARDGISQNEERAELGSAPTNTSIPPALDAALQDALRQAMRAYGADKAVAAAPTGATAVVDDFTLEGQLDGSCIFSWSYRNPGDYDQNSQVNISDLTPVGISFGKKQSDSDWQKHEPVDGDANGQITIADVTPIGQHFNVSVDGYELQFTLTPESEASWQSGQIAAFDTSTVPAGGGRRRFALQLPATDNSLAEGMNFRVRPFLGEGAGREYGVPSLSVQLGTGVGPNTAPIAVLQAAPQEGLAPLSVILNANSSGDIDGVIEKYELDYDGPIGGENWTDMEGVPIKEHTYNAVGDYLCALRVTDDRGATDTDVTLIKARSQTPPVAAVTAETLSGPTPLQVVWDASASADPDGLVLNYQWDFNNDGEFEYDSGAEPTADFYYYEPGDFPVSVRVTDNDGLTGDASSSASPTLGASWHVQTVPTPAGFSAMENCACRLIDLGGRPAACFGVDDNVDDPDTRFLAQSLVRGIDAQATAWDTPTLIPPDIANPAASTAQSSSFGLSIVGGVPAYATLRRFWLAQDTDGTAWNDPVEAYGQNVNVNWDTPEMLVMQGKPILLAPNGIIPASDALGQTWLPATRFVQSSGDDASGVVIGERAFCALTYAQGSNSSMFVYRSLASDGTSWSAPIVVDPGSSAGIDPEMIDAGGNPAVFYYDKVTSSVKFSRASDALGKQWSSPATVALFASDSIAGGTIEGRPALVFKDLVGSTLRIIIANQPECLSWSMPSVVASDGGGVGYWAGSSDLTEVDGLPALLYRGPNIDDSPPRHAEVRFAAYW